MVMATVSVCQQFSGELSHEAGDATDDASAEATALHERLVAYVHALAGGHEPRSGVWVEHSYARARGVAHAPSAHVRVLLAPRLPDERGDVDVERVEPSPPELPGEPEPERDDSDPEHDDDWEACVTALAPSAAHTRLAESALDSLRRMRLERLAGGRADTAARTAARRLRLALAAAAAHPAAHAQRPGPWLHATLHAYLPRAERRLYDELEGELRRAAPRLAERALGARALPPRRDPLARVGPPLGADSSPWLVWLGCGRPRLDARWVRRLGALVYTRVLAGEAGAGAGRLAPDAWCAAVAGGVRAALGATLAEAGARPVVLGGVGAGAALVTALAGGVRVRGLLLLAPPLLTAAGARDAPDDALWEVRAPLLVVAGAGAAGSWRGAAREVARAREGAGARAREGGARRLLELAGADDALRLAGAVRRRRRLPQHALDAAVAEECARWVIETASHAAGESPACDRPRWVIETASHTAGESPACDRPRWVIETPSHAAGESPARDRPRRRRAPPDEEDYAHLPPALPSDRAMESVGETSNSVSLSSGRVVSRGSGATPLALLPPRRRAASPAPAALQAADIMRLPIVFADDEPALDEAAASPVTVTSGSRGYTRVIVASRGGPRVRPGTARPDSVRPGPARPDVVRPARPVLLRRGLRLLQRADRPH